MIERYTAAALQFEPRLGAKRENLARLCALADEAAGAGARVIVMPEMAVIGYCWRDRVEVAPLVETVPGPTTDLFVEIARRHGCYIVVGLAERDPMTDLYYNTAALVGPDGVVCAYRKSHAFIAEPRWAAESVNTPPVVATPYGHLGLFICMDADYMEPARLLGVAGCDVALFPTCWLDEKAPSAAWMARAYENGMYLVAADRFGCERGVQFSGGSCVLDPDGAVVAMRDTGEGTVYGEVDLSRTRTRPFSPGEPDDKLAGRRPAAYVALAQHAYLWNPLQSHSLYGERGLDAGSLLRVGVAQTSAPNGDDRRLTLDAEGRDALRRSVVTGMGDGVDLLVLPALPLLSRSPRDAAEAAGVAEGMDGPTAHWLCALAADLRAHVVGSLVERDGASYYLTVALVAAGGVVGRYRALHPSRAANAWATPGDLGLPVFDLPGVRVGLLYGRDILLPEPARVLALAGADVICAPAALTGPLPRGLPASAVPFAAAQARAADPRHFHLWRQRAHENNTVVAFANRGAPHGMGESGVFGPELGSLDALVPGSAPGVAVLDVDTRSQSERFPTAPVRVKELLRQRVPAMYAPLVACHEGTPRNGSTSHVGTLAAGHQCR
jgi:predicted amidohydrolase